MSGLALSFTAGLAELLGTERRAEPRRYCNLEACFLLWESRCPSSWRQATVWDVSPKGVGLVLTRCLRPGDLLSVELQSQDGGHLLTVPARVAHVTRAPDGWFAGCMFLEPLCEVALQVLLPGKLKGRAAMPTYKVSPAGKPTPGGPESPRILLCGQCGEALGVVDSAVGPDIYSDLSCQTVVVLWPDLADEARQHERRCRVTRSSPCP